MRPMTLAVFFLVTLLGTAVSTGVQAACSVRSIAEHPHLVELYTTQGCSSCPPAENWLSSLRGKTDVVGLAFHVDYWDTSSWSDPFDKHAYTERQIMLANRTKSKQYYTPQIWLDGQLWSDWPKGAPPTLYAGPSPTLQLSVQKAASVLHTSVNVSNLTSNSGTLQAYVALSENGLSQQIKGGENQGLTLAQNQVVRAFAGPLQLPVAITNLTLPAKVDLAQSSVVAFLQDDQSGDVVQVVRLPLKECTLGQATNGAP